MIETLRRICALQPAYSPQNTEPMQERGRLIRQTLPTELRAIQAELNAALGIFGPELAIGASDGIGRKTEAPWVRIFATSMSPTPREGFYVVIHFAANGSSVFITVGCGSTIWANGELRAVSDMELARRTDWARAITREAFGSLAPFDDKIILGAKASLPRTFEKATAWAHCIPLDELNEERIVELLLLATRRLQSIYDAQRAGRNLTGAAAVELMVEQLATPARTRFAGQGFGLSAGERQAVENRAMLLSQVWLKAQGFDVTDMSAISSFDFEASKADGTFKIEVKGTTNDSADAILMTHREVELHRSEKGATGLIVVSGIRLKRTGKEFMAEGGIVQVELGWDIDTWDAAPIAFKLTRHSI